MDPSSTPEGGAVLQPATVLVVDDLDANRLAISELIRPLGVVVVEAASGEEALRQCLTHDFALILMDVQMPFMDGFETVRHLRAIERTRSIPVVFLTAGDLGDPSRAWK